MPSLFWFDSFLEASAENEIWFRSIFGSNENEKICFRNLLTFNSQHFINHLVTNTKCYKFHRPTLHSSLLGMEISTWSQYRTKWGQSLYKVSSNFLNSHNFSRCLFMDWYSSEGRQNSSALKSNYYRRLLVLWQGIWSSKTHKPVTLL